MAWVADKIFWLLLKIWLGPVDVIIGDHGNPYMLRWYLVPHNRFLNVYLHRFLRDDDDRALHDHPWWSASLCLRGSYLEIDRGGSRKIRKGQWRFLSAKYAHRIALSRNATDIETDVFTLFITGPKVRDWGFHCPDRWVPWREFTADNGQTIGKGCGE